MRLNIILSATKDGVIGQTITNDLFITSRNDLQRFKELTTQSGQTNILIMGYYTWKSLPKVLPGRIHVVLSRNHEVKTDGRMLYVFKTMPEIFEWCEKNHDNANIFVIGGGQVYSEVLTKYNCLVDNVYLTEFGMNCNLEKESDKVSFDLSLLKSYRITSSEELYDSVCKIFQKMTNKIDDSTRLNVKYLTYRYENKGEEEYLDMLSEIITKGSLCESRNGNTISIFGGKMEFNMSDGFPLLTTKQMPWKTILRELLWFLSGSTDNKELNKQKVHIWDGNASKEYLETRGLKYKEGDLGPIYGFQWRYFGAQYRTCDDNYGGQGVDQINYVINEIINNPSSRRIIMSAWNPLDLDKMSLPPCHVMCQFHVDQKNNKLDCQLYQRSGDMFLGVPFNIASYSFLLYIISKLTGYTPGRFIHIFGDCHIYENHIEQVKLQLERRPRPFPTLVMDDLIDINLIDEMLFKIQDYSSFPGIKAPMSA